MARNNWQRHGESGGGATGRKPSPEYKSWIAAKSRCSNLNDTHYGGRGITMCTRWHYHFDVFLADMGRRPSPQHTLDRIDVNGPYAPENCRWATRAEQARNRRPMPPGFYQAIAAKGHAARWGAR